MNRDLERLLWRWQYGRLDPALLELHLRDAVDRAEDEDLEWRDAASALATWNPALPNVHVTARREALLAVDRHQFREAVHQLNICRTATATLRELVAADREASLCGDVLGRLHDAIGASRLRTMPSVASLSQQLEAIRLGILDAHYIEAILSARLCTRLAGRLLENDSPASGANHDELQGRIRELARLVRRTQAFASPNDDPLPAVERLRVLLRDGRSTLVSRLLAELEIELGPRRRFLSAQPLMSSDAGEVKKIVGQFSWDGAVDHYWRLSISHNTDRLTLEHQRASAATAAVTAAIESA